MEISPGAMSREEERTPVLPHVGPMRWVTTARLSADGQMAIADVKIGPNHVCVRDGVFLASAMIELMAQVAAAGLALRMEGTHRRIKRGVLAAMQACELMSLVVTDEGITVRGIAVHEKSFGALSRAVVEVRGAAGEIVGRAVMTFHTEFE